MSDSSSQSSPNSRPHTQVVSPQDLKQPEGRHQVGLWLHNSLPLLVQVLGQTLAFSQTTSRRSVPDAGLA